MSPTQRHIVRVSFLALAAALIFGYFMWQHAHPQLVEYAVYPGPSGRYRVVVYSLPRVKPAMPGRGGEVPGVVRLLDRSGRVLQETKVETVQLVSEVTWKDRLVHIKLIADWPLPE